MILIVCFSSLSSEVSPRPTGFDFMCRIQAGKEGTRKGGNKARRKRKVYDDCICVQEVLTSLRVDGC